MYILCMMFYFFGFFLFFFNNVVDYLSYVFKLYMFVNVIYIIFVGRSDFCLLRFIFFLLIDKRNIFLYFKVG